MFYPIGDTANSAGLSYQQLVKEQNIKRVFDLLRSGRCDSRADLVHAMALSATSISALVEELCARGYVTEAGPKPTAQPGRRPIQLRFNEDAGQIVCFTVTRQGVRYTILNLGCEILENACIPFSAARFNNTDAGNAYASLFMDILQHQSKCFDPERAICIGVCVPAIYHNRSQVFSMDSSIGFHFSKASMLALQRDAHIPVYLANNTMCLAYAEKKCLEPASGGQPVQDLVYISIGDGVGASIISRGDVFAGANNNAGEIGHITIDYNGRPCPCGNRGCLERYVNQNAILNLAGSKAAAEGLSLPESLTDLSGLIAQGCGLDEQLDELANYLACGICNMICATGISRILLGGGIEVLGEALLSRVYRAVTARTTLLCDDIALAYACAGEQSDDIGFAHYFLDKAFTITA